MMITFIKDFKTLLMLEWKNFSRSQGQWLFPVMLFVLIIVLFTLGVDPVAARLREMGPAIIWCAYLLSLLLALDHLWRDDYQTGVLEQMMLHSRSPMQMLLHRIVIRWIFSIAPLLLFLPLALSMLQMPMSVYLNTLLALLSGSFVFWSIGAVLSALTLTDKRSALMSLLLLPFSVPLVVFGSQVIKNSIEGGAVSGMILLLSGLCVLSLSIVPWLVHSAIRLNLD
jgi:heme exporter protein B